MFHFNFGFDDVVDDFTVPDPFAVPSDQANCDTVFSPQEAFSEIDLESLLEALPTQLSYSYLSLPSSDAHSSDLKLARRDLFDARFQLISEGTGDPDHSTSEPSDESNPNSTASALQFIDNPSDLVPLVYEGGLKTWECSLDLASCLKCDGHASNAKGRRVLELGCGTAIPTLCILQEMFTSPPTEDAETHIHLQDYNPSVLKLVTMPNIILAWYTSPAADAYKSSEAASEDAHSEVHLTPQLLKAFETSLRSYRVHLRFFSGAWHAFDLARAGGRPYDLVLTAETIYHPRALPSLVHLLQDASARGKDSCVCLVAAKTVYFGVGGGITEFARAVEAVARPGCVETIWETSAGVSRKVMRVWWT